MSHFRVLRFHMVKIGGHPGHAALAQCPSTFHLRRMNETVDLDVFTFHAIVWLDSPQSCPYRSSIALYLCHLLVNWFYTGLQLVIHVSDEVKNLKREYKCSQKLLVSKMGYFAEVTTGQKLEDMDISVHCDMDTFDWLIRWIKKETVPSNEWPLLDAGNVLPILVSAAFLQMDPLLNTCLLYCHDRMNEVIETSDTIGGLNDNNIVRLCDMFSNSEVEQLEDRRDKIKSRLYTKLIVSLVDSEVAPQRGHYSSLRNVFRCAKCDKLVLSERCLRLENLCYRVPCRPENMWLGRCGDILSFHDRDIKWNLKDHIVSLFETLKSWREVYWRLWGECHFLYCGVCRSLFPVCQMQWCLYHKEAPQFFTMEHQRTVTFPIGRYPCCGMKAFRFDPLENSPGCQFREHDPVRNTQDSMEIFKIFRKYEKLISVSCSVQIVDRQKLSLQFRLKGMSVMKNLLFCYLQACLKLIVCILN
ncbi:hypothetical protein PR048_003249 [Dryococelus australis]|uniref:SANT and BTB domain-containing protein n=1 Tax=Dryococelus australis TaxID=614101 RepID=A0ABQ9IN26_9NEOP|nr:hypothetical protein PR048_003249 [Dryococelus australis]